MAKFLHQALCLLERSRTAGTTERLQWLRRSREPPVAAFEKTQAFLQQRPQHFFKLLRLPVKPQVRRVR